MRIIASFYKHEQVMFVSHLDMQRLFNAHSGAPIFRLRIQTVLTRIRCFRLQPH